MRTVVIVDAKNLVYRAHFGHPDLATSSGQPTSILFGVPVMLLDIDKMVPNADVVVAWEGTMMFDKGSRVKTRPIWRKEYCDKYKANRIKDPKMERAENQLPELYRFLSIIGWPQLCVPALEADDVIGVLAHKLNRRSDVGTVLIYSKDQDFHQLLRPGLLQLLPSRDGAKVFGPQDVLQTKGVTPRKFLSLRALAGDTSDNIKPIKGVGEKTALKMLEDGIDPRLETWKEHAKAIRKKYPNLEEVWPAVRKAYHLSKIPKQFSYPFFPVESQAALHTQVMPILRDAGRVMSHKVRKQRIAQFEGFCREYEMDFVEEQSYRFFKNVREK
jgi:DNA polymerase-1